MLRSDYARLRPAAALFPHWRPVRWRLLPLRVKRQPKIVALSRVAAADARLRAEWKEGEEKGGGGQERVHQRDSAVRSRSRMRRPAAMSGDAATSEQQHSSKWKWTRGGGAGGWVRFQMKLGWCIGLITVQFELCMSLKGRKQASFPVDPEIWWPWWWRCHKVKMEEEGKVKVNRHTFFKICCSWLVSGK